VRDLYLINMAAAMRPVLVSEAATAAAAANNSQHPRQHHQPVYGDVDVYGNSSSFVRDDDVGRRQFTDVEEGRSLYADADAGPRRCSRDVGEDDAKSDNEADDVDGMLFTFGDRQPRPGQNPLRHNPLLCCSTWVG